MRSSEKIRLTGNKSSHGMERVRRFRMHQELVKALKWWRDARPCKVANVFMQLQNDTFLGQSFTRRIHFMERFCRKPPVKPFGFHSIRHKSAAITFMSSGLNAARFSWDIIRRPRRAAIEEVRGRTRTRAKFLRLRETAASGR